MAKTAGLGLWMMCAPAAVALLPWAMRWRHAVPIEGAEGRVAMLSDGSGAFAHALGLPLALSARGFGVRSKRFAMLVTDRVVTYLGVEPGTEVGVSGAGAVLEALG